MFENPVESRLVFTEKIFIQFDSATDRDTGERYSSSPRSYGSGQRSWNMPASE